MSKKRNLNELRDYFEALQLQDWVFSGNLNNGGQADIAEVKNTQTDEIGILRVLQEVDDEEQRKIEVQRFNRELKILTEYSHPNIVQILEYTRDNNSHWYISKKGDSFDKYWKQVQRDNLGNNDKLVEEAIRIIATLANGLIDLHHQGVIHRDIKFSNIIVENENPILIDFGISFIAGEERISDMPVCNLLGIDPASSLGDKVLPWLDVFLLSQMVIKMTCLNSNKQKQVGGPRDWRWVSYPEGQYQSRLIALVAACSNAVTSPKNASEFKNLLDFLFYNKPIEGDDIFKQKAKEINKILKENRAKEIINFSDSRQVIESKIPIIKILAKDFTSAMQSLAEEFNGYFNVSLEIDPENNESFEKEFHENSKYNLRQFYRSNIQKIIVAQQGYKISCDWHLQIYTDDTLRDQSFKNSPILSFGFRGVELSNLDTKYHTSSNYHILPSTNGTLELYDGNINFVLSGSLEEIISFIREIFTDSDVWNIASK